MAWAMTGSSLTTGRLSTDWVPTLTYQAQTFPECKGPVFVYNMGHGSWTSLDILANIPELTAANPTHVFLETGSINDCVDFGSGPAVSLSTHNVNVTSMVSQLRARNSGVVIVIVTMSSVSSYQTARTTLPNYYSADVSLAGSLGCLLLDNYTGTVTVPGGWPKPLNGMLTNGSLPQQYPTPTGFTLWSPTPQFDPAALGPGLVLGNANQVLTSTAPLFSSSTGRGVLAQSTGKLYQEFMTTATVNKGYFFGVCTAAATLSDYLGSDNFGYGYDGFDGSVQHGGTAVASYSAYLPGDLIGAAVDFGLGKLWFAKNGVWQGFGNPATGSGGVTLSPGTYYLAATLMVGDNVEMFPLLGDGLHPVASAVNTYFYPNIVVLMRQLMATFWP
jgi:hypothetical protein